MPDRVTVQEHESRRYRQIAKLERDLQLKGAEVRDCKSHAKDLEREYDGILSALRSAARDEGELPLLDMMDQLEAAATGSKTN